MKKFRIPFTDMLKTFVFGLIGILVVAGLLGFRLGSLTAGASDHELSTVQAVQSRSLSIHDVIDNPLYLPHKIGQVILEKSGFTTLTAVRSIGGVFGLVGAICFYLILRKWHTRRIAIMGTILLVTSNWFLHSARIAAPESAFLLIPLLLYLAIRMRARPSLFVFGLLFLSASLLVYIPGLIWLILPATIWYRNELLDQLRSAGKLWTAIYVVGSLLVLAPLAISLVTHSEIRSIWLGYDNTLSFGTIARNLLHVPLQIFIRSDYAPMNHLGQLPFLDIATSIFVLLGAYWYFFQRRLDRVKILLAGLILGGILAALNPSAMIILLPFIYFAVAGGVTLMLQQWFTVFPRNPLARNIGVGLVVIVIGLTSFYHMRRYYIAWPKAPETKSVYHNQL